MEDLELYLCSDLGSITAACCHLEVSDQVT